MYYTVYKITNKLDGKFYIGKHKTKNLDDGYMGSGKLIKRAIEKHGVENFEKEVLHVFETEAEMNEAEARLVVLGEDSYNLCPGGHGGWGYVNTLEDAIKWRLIGRLKANSIHGSNINHSARMILFEKRKDPDWNAAYCNKLSQGAKQRSVHGFQGKCHSAESLKKISDKKKGSGTGSCNSQYGTFWITNGVINRKMPAKSTIPEGWVRGRKLFIG